VIILCLMLAYMDIIVFLHIKPCNLSRKHVACAFSISLKINIGISARLHNVMSQKKVVYASDTPRIKLQDITLIRNNQ
jgi:hypothetical protein